MRAPAAAPCRFCPYRRDVPSGVWDADEYAKLPPYDLPTGEQPHGVFRCHVEPDRVCAGWAAVHDMGECLALRLAAAFDRISGDDYAATLDYRTPVPVFPSGADAAAHGLADLARPGAAARAAMKTLGRKLARRRTPTEGKP